LALAIDENETRTDRVRAAAGEEWNLNTRQRWRGFEERLGLSVPA
jgi:hypothetical protein